MQHTQTTDGRQLVADHVRESHARERCNKSETVTRDELADLAATIDEIEFQEFQDLLSGKRIVRGSNSPAEGGERASCTAAAAAPLHRLETIDNNVTRVVLTSHKCRCRTCKVCGKKRGWTTRQRLVGKSAMWRKPALFTLTIDRKKFSSPAHAWRVVTGKRFVARLMKLLGVKLWVWVLEYQQKTGSGWPHWHLLIDLGDLPGERLNLNKAWDIWWRKWKLGMLDLSEHDVEFKPVTINGQEFTAAQCALLYITKYLVKQPDGGYPTWVLKSRRMIRFCQGSKQLGAIVADATNDQDDDDQDDEPDTRRSRRPLLDRMAFCERSGRIFEMIADPSTGEEKPAYVGQVPCSPERLLGASQRGEIAARIEEERDDQGKTTIVLKTSLRAFQLELRAKWWYLAGETWDRVKLNRQEILRENRFARREFFESKTVDSRMKSYEDLTDAENTGDGFDSAGTAASNRPPGQGPGIESIDHDGATPAGWDRPGRNLRQSDEPAHPDASTRPGVLSSWSAQADGSNGE